MTPENVQVFLALVRSYYPAFYSPSSTQLALWTADLADDSDETAQEALRRWVRWHGTQPPQLGDLLSLIKEVEFEAVRWRSAAEAEPVERSADQATMLQHMARLNQRMLGPWEDATGALHSRLTLTQAAALCRRWSARYRHRPALAQDFAVMAGAYDTMAGDAAA